MLNLRLFHAALVVAGLTIAIHLDWHLARDHGRFSLGWDYHWVTAIPIFALATWHTAQSWPGQAVRAGLLSILAAVVLGQLLEPLAESIFYRLPYDQGFSAERLRAFVEFTGAGIVVFLLATWWLGRRAHIGQADGGVET